MTEQAKHTPEPWTTNGESIFGPTMGLAGRWMIARTATHTSVDRANMERIVACVNSCEGLADPQATITALVGALRALVERIEAGGAVKREGVTGAAYNVWMANFGEDWCDVFNAAESALALVPPAAQGEK